MNVLFVGTFAVLIAISVMGVAATSWMYGGGGGGLDALAEQPPRLLDALAAGYGPDESVRRPDEGFWRALEHDHPYLVAALDFDEQIPAQDRARYDSFWAALRDQDDVFWFSLGRGDDRRWAQLEDEHGVQVPVPVSAGGGS